MNFILHKQKPVARKNGVAGYLVGDNKHLRFISHNGETVTELIKTEFVYAGTDSLMFRGFEPNGFETSGRAKYLYQEWRLRYDNH